MSFQYYHSSTSYLLFVSTSTHIENQFITELRSKISGEVYNDKIYRKLYSTDASNYEVEPDAVMFPKNTRDVQEATKICAQKGVSIISRGGGSSLSGQSVGKGLVMDYSRFMYKILEWKSEEFKVTVEPGVALASLNNYLAAKGQMIGPDPSSALVACIGGMVGNNTTGSHSILYGMMLDQVNAIEAVLANGERIYFSEKTAKELENILTDKSSEARLYRGVLDILHKYQEAIENNYPDIWRNVAGYNLNRLWERYKNEGTLNLASLLVGSEGTLASMVAMEVKTVKRPIHTRLALVHFEEVAQACMAVPLLLETQPGAIEFSNDYFHELIDANSAFQEIYRSTVVGIPQALLIVEYTAEQEADFDKKFEQLREKLGELGHTGDIVYRNTLEEVNQVWQMRKAGFGLLMSQRGDAKPQTFADDATVPVDRLAGFVTEMEEIFEREGIRVAMVGHASAGCIHMNPNINLKTPEGVKQMESMAIAIAETAFKYGGSHTGEHGEGYAKSYFNEQLYGSELHQAFREIKELFDPNYLLQPGKILDAKKPWDEDILRYNSQYQTPLSPKDTVLDFSKDGGFSGLVEMCNGTGFCRKDSGGVMCPSYRVTRDERHSTRGRANALRAAIKGELKEGLSDKELYNTLDLCLECKACKVECPSIVDMAKLKYEYLYQYQQKHGIPLKNKLFAQVHKINRFSHRFRWIYNSLINQKGLRLILEKVSGIDRRRMLPLLAKEDFHQWFYSRKRNAKQASKQVVLWDDTYLSFNQPELGKASVKVLEAAGYEVLLAEKRACCGRPMISKGLLEEAKQLAEHNVALLLPYAEKGIPILGIEPSCIASFQDEYPDLVQNEAARVVAAHSYFIEDFIVEKMEAGAFGIDFPPQESGPHIKFHGHCYQKALGSTSNSVKLLQMIPGAEVEEILSGCCGMAGSFGYEKKHYEISMACGEEVLFPVIRNSTPNTFFAASGFSCRHQIGEGTAEKAFHPIEILANFLSSPYETDYIQSRT